MDPFTCPRKDIVEQLIEILDTARVAHVRGTPALRKSTLAVLLARRLLEDGRKVVLLRSWPSGISGDNYEEVLVQRAFKT
jgi:putative protein kinase ArgK-like GTPase of G3E family